jgi:hypothetical protein
MHGDETNFQVMCDNFQVYIICASENYPQKHVS